LNYEKDFPLVELPHNGIIRLSEQKFVRTRNLMYRYQEIGFTDFSIVELASMSLAQWKRRDYSVPKGFKLHRSKILIKIPPDELMYNRVFKRKKEI